MEPEQKSLVERFSVEFHTGLLFGFGNPKGQLGTGKKLNLLDKGEQHNKHGRGPCQLYRKKCNHALPNSNENHCNSCISPTITNLLTELFQNESIVSVANFDIRRT